MSVTAPELCCAWHTHASSVFASARVWAPMRPCAAVAAVRQRMRRFYRAPYARYTFDLLHNTVLSALGEVAEAGILPRRRGIQELPTDRKGVR